MISIKTDRERAQAALTDAVEQVQAYHGSQLQALVMNALDALADLYKAELVTVPPEQLLHKQTALRQTLAIRDSLFAGGATPRI